MTVKLIPAGAETGVRGVRDEADDDPEERELDEDVDVNDAAFITFLPFHGISLTGSGMGGVGGMYPGPPGKESETLDDEKYIENALLVMDVRDIRFEAVLPSFIFRSWSLSLLQYPKKSRMMRFARSSLISVGTSSW